MAGPAADARVYTCALGLSREIRLTAAELCVSLVVLASPVPLASRPGPLDVVSICVFKWVISTCPRTPTCH
jgi:hypothetical protein